jgi:hypothetical protein
MAAIHGGSGTSRTAAPVRSELPSIWQMRGAGRSRAHRRVHCSIASWACCGDSLAAAAPRTPHSQHQEPASGRGDRLATVMVPLAGLRSRGPSCPPPTVLTTIPRNRRLAIAMAAADRPPVVRAVLPPPRGGELASGAVPHVGAKLARDPAWDAKLAHGPTWTCLRSPCPSCPPPTVLTTIPRNRRLAIAMAAADRPPVVRAVLPPPRGGELAFRRGPPRGREARARSRVGRSAPARWPRATGPPTPCS